MKVPVFRDEVFRCGVEIREIAATAARDSDLFADGLVVFEKGNPPSAFPGFDGAHQAGGSSANDDNVENHN